MKKKRFLLRYQLCLQFVISREREAAPLTESKNTFGSHGGAGRTKIFQEKMKEFHLNQINEQLPTYLDE